MTAESRRLSDTQADAVLRQRREQKQEAEAGYEETENDTVCCAGRGLRGVDAVPGCYGEGQ